MGIPEKPSGGCARWALIGCGGMSLLLLIATMFIYFYWPSIVATGIRYNSDALLEESAVDESVKENFRIQRDRVLKEYEDETIENAVLSIS